NISVVFAEPGVIIATIFVTLPLMIREMIPVIAALDREQEHAAATLGARGWQIFRLVTLPAIRWGLLYGVALTFARALGEFGAVLVVGNDIQGSTETAPLYIYRAINNNDFGSAFVVALALGALSLGLVASVEWLRRRHAIR
ncbi:MAG TPA: ABC transporter permease subunit, partial [Ktedonobacterales bacterium]|nr:ABC transporter permease subunit [Ktedonobacterales bacterium]